MHKIKTSEKSGHVFEGEQEIVYERVWREESNGKNLYLYPKCIYIICIPIYTYIIFQIKRLITLSNIFYLIKLSKGISIIIYIKTISPMFYYF